MPRRSDGEANPIALVRVRGPKKATPNSPLVESLRYDLHDPMTWRARTGQIVIPLAKAAFDVAEKTLVVAAFSAAAQLTTDSRVIWLSFGLGLLLALYVTFQAEKVIAQGFAYMRWHGIPALVNFGLLMLALFAVTSAVAVPGLQRVTDAIIEATR